MILTEPVSIKISEIQKLKKSPTGFPDTFIYYGLYKNEHIIHVSNTVEDIGRLIILALQEGKEEIEVSEIYDPYEENKMRGLFIETLIGLCGRKD